MKTYCFDPIVLKHREMAFLYVTVFIGFSVILHCFSFNVRGCVSPSTLAHVLAFVLRV